MTFSTEIGMEMRCYGPTLIKDTPWPPREKPNLGFPKTVMSAVLGVINQETDQPITDPDPIGLNLVAEKMFAVFNRYSVNSFQVPHGCLLVFVYLCMYICMYVCPMSIIYLSCKLYVHNLKCMYVCMYVYLKFC